MEELLLLELGHYPGFSELETPLQKCLVEDAITEVKDAINCPGQEALPSDLKRIAKEIVLIRLNKLGAEGIAATSQSGVSESYLEDLPTGLRRQLRRYRKLPRRKNEH